MIEEIKMPPSQRKSDALAIVENELLALIASD